MRALTLKPVPAQMPEHTSSIVDTLVVHWNLESKQPKVILARF